MFITTMMKQDEGAEIIYSKQKTVNIYVIILVLSCINAFAFLTSPFMIK